MSKQASLPELQDRIRQLERETSKTSALRKELQQREGRLQDLVERLRPPE